MNLKLRKSRPDEYIDEYLAELAATHRSEHTLRSYRGTLQAWKESGLEPRPWVLERSARLKASSANHARTVLMVYLNWCVVNGYLDKNPLARTRPAREPKRMTRVLTVEEVARLVEACAHLGKQRVRGEHTQNLGHLPIEAYRARLGAMVAVQVTAGLRVTELSTIPFASVDLQRRTLRVVGKGDKEREVRIGKSAKRKIEDWLDHRPDAGPYLFNIESGGPVSPRVYHRQLQEACWWAGLPPVKPHTLRHTFATHAISSGISLIDVKDMLGHDHISTTMLYVNRAPEKGWARYDDSHPLSGDE